MQTEFEFVKDKKNDKSLGLVYVNSGTDFMPVGIRLVINLQSAQNKLPSLLSINPTTRVRMLLLPIYYSERILV